MDVIDALDRTYQHAQGVIAGVVAEQLGIPTPCADWTVRDLLEHMIGVVAGLGAAASRLRSTRPRAPTPPTNWWRSSAVVVSAAR